MLSIERHHAMLSRSQARVGLARVGNATQVAEHYKRTNANIISTENDISKWEIATQDLIHQRVVSGTFSPDCKKGADVSYCMLPSENKTNAWIKNSWVPFVQRWNSHISYVRVGWFDDDLEATKYDKELMVLRNEFGSLTTQVLPPLTATMTEMDKSWDPVGGVKTALGGTPGSPSIMDTVERLVWIGGILLIGYFGIVYILPAFLGAGSSARAAKRRYEEA